MEIVKSFLTFGALDAMPSGSLLPRGLAAVVALLAGLNAGMKVGETHPEGKTEAEASGQPWDVIRVRARPGSPLCCCCKRKGSPRAAFGQQRV